jgi:hypothetical protein
MFDGLGNAVLEDREVAGREIRHRLAVASENADIDRYHRDL